MAIKAYLFSALLHFSFAVFLFFLAIAPAKTYFPGKIEQVFLVAAASTPSISVGAPFMAPAGSMNRAPTIKEEQLTKPSPAKPETSLAEKLKTRLAGISSDLWNPKAPVRSGGEQTDKTGSALNSTSASARTGNPPAGQQPDSSGGVVRSSADGSALIESEAGFPDGWYLTLLSRRLTERWNPVQEGIATVKREVVVLFTITRDGRIKDIALTHASGNLKFDRSGMTAVAECDFLPPLPASWEKDSLQVSVRFREK